MSATVPFRQWIEQGCPAIFDWDGTKAEATEALSHEYDAIATVGPQPLDDWEFEQLGLPQGSTNEEAYRILRESWPLRR